MTAAAKTGKLAWPAGGHYLTSTTHIANVCEAVALALSKGRSGEIYFIADGAPVQFRSFITSMLATRGLAAPTKSVPRWVMRGTVTIGDFLAALSGGRIKPPISRQEFVTMAFEATLDTRRRAITLGTIP